MPPKKKVTVSSDEIRLPPLDIRTFNVTLIGDSPLICHAWSHKAKEQMLAKQMKKARQAKEAKSPETDFRDSLYIVSGGEQDDPQQWVCGFPAVGFKSAAVDACSHVEGVTKVSARGAFHLQGDMVVISGTPTPRQDMVRIGMGTADIRYRGEFREWSARITVRHNASVLAPEQIIHLLNVAGFAIGVGEWRPQKDGSFGMFHVATAEEISQ